MPTTFMMSGSDAELFRQTLSILNENGMHSSDNERLLKVKYEMVDRELLKIVGFLNEAKLLNQKNLNGIIQSSIPEYTIDKLNKAKLLNQENLNVIIQKNFNTSISRTYIILAINILDENRILNQGNLDGIFQHFFGVYVCSHLYDGLVQLNIVELLNQQSFNMTLKFSGFVNSINILRKINILNQENVNMMIQNPGVIAAIISLDSSKILNQEILNMIIQYPGVADAIAALSKAKILNKENLNMIIQHPGVFAAIAILNNVMILNQENLNVIIQRSDIVAAIYILNNASLLNQESLNIIVQRSFVVAAIDILDIAKLLNQENLNMIIQSYVSLHAICILNEAELLNQENLNMIERRCEIVTAIDILNDAKLLNQENLNMIVQFSDVVTAIEILNKVKLLNQENLNMMALCSGIAAAIYALNEVKLLNQENLNMIFQRFDVVVAIDALHKAKILSHENLNVIIKRSDLAAAIDALHKAKILSHENLNIIVQRSDVVSAIDILHKAKILNQTNLNAVSKKHVNSKNIAITIKLNHLLTYFDALVENRNKSNLHWFKDIFIKSYRIANMEFSIASTYRYVKGLTDAFISLNLHEGNKVNPSVTNHAIGKTFKRAQISSICDVCTIADNDKSVILDCGHNYHTECFALGVKSYLEQERLDKIGVCLHEGCHHKLTPMQLATIVTDPETIVAIQRLLIRSIDGVLFCPSCPYGLTKKNKYLGFSSACKACSKESCFSCGGQPHSGMTCEKSKLYHIEFLKEIIRNNESDNYGKCPHCKVTVGKHSGCNEMVCGRDKDGSGPMFYYKGKGCGKSFNWGKRIKIEDYLQGISKNRLNFKKF